MRFSNLLNSPKLKKVKEFLQKNPKIVVIPLVVFTAFSLLPTVALLPIIKPLLLIGATAFASKFMYDKINSLSNGKGGRSGKNPNGEDQNNTNTNTNTNTNNLQISLNADGLTSSTLDKSNDLNRLTNMPMKNSVANPNRTSPVVKKSSDFKMSP